VGILGGMGVEGTGLFSDGPGLRDPGPEYAGRLLRDQPIAIDDSPGN